jgi:hypothetical protein
MGISLANLADYEGSAKYYVRALTLNPRCDKMGGGRGVCVWGGVLCG